MKKVVFVSGKHYYTLAKHAQDNAGSSEVAVIRVEQLCPFPVKELREEVAKYKNAESKFFRLEC